MDIRDRQTLKSRAKSALTTASYDPKKLILIHTGATFLALLVLALVNFLLQNQINQAGGLGGMGTRTILATIQTLLDYAKMVLLPFWNMGYVAATLRLARGQTADPRSLLAGFQNWGAVIRTTLLKALLIGGLSTMCFYPSLMIYSLTPLSAPLVALVLPYLETGANIADAMLSWDNATLAAAQNALIPLMVIYIAVLLLVCTPLFYRFRLVDLALMDTPQAGAFRSLRKSALLTRRRCLDLFRLDLSFWWYYVLELLLAALAYGDVLLPLAGVELPFSGEFAYYLFLALYLVGQTALYWAVKNQISVTYATAYDALCQAGPAAAPQPKTQPWNYE